jgi:predicted metal-dependent enzyme (double-stranded beta helix superfamily)
MTPRELIAHVRALAGRPEHWAHLVAHDPEQRVYHEIQRDDDLAVWLICWSHEQDTGFHDHDLSAGAVAVVSGAVREDRLTLGGPPVQRTVEAGGAFAFTAADIHRVQHVGDTPAVTLHAYSPPLWRMGAYEVDADGRLRRHSISYAEELRPLSAPL